MLINTICKSHQNGQGILESQTKLLNNRNFNFMQFIILIL